MNLACILDHKAGDDLTPDELKAMSNAINEVVEEHGYRVNAFGPAPQAAITLAHKIAEDAQRLSGMLYRTPAPDLVPLSEVIEILRAVADVAGNITATDDVRDMLLPFCERWGIDPESDLEIEP